MKIITFGENPSQLRITKKNKAQTKKEIQHYITKYNPDYVLMGLRPFFDFWVAEYCIKQKIPFQVALPCENQELPWPPKTQQKYKWLLSKAMKIIEIDKIPLYYSHDVPVGCYHPHKMAQAYNYLIQEKEEKDKILVFTSTKQTKFTKLINSSFVIRDSIIFIYDDIPF